MAMMDVTEMFVVATDGEVAVLSPGEHLDRPRSMVRIGRINRVRVLHGFVTMDVPVMAGCDHENADEWSVHSFAEHSRRAGRVPASLVDQ